MAKGVLYGGVIRRAGAQGADCGFSQPRGCVSFVTDWQPLGHCTAALVLKSLSTDVDRGMRTTLRFDLFSVGNAAEVPMTTIPFQILPIEGWQVHTAWQVPEQRDVSCTQTWLLPIDCHAEPSWFLHTVLRLLQRRMA